MTELQKLIEKYQISERDLYVLSVIEDKKKTSGIWAKQKLSNKFMGIMKIYKVSFMDLGSIRNAIQHRKFHLDEGLISKYGEINLDNEKSSSGFQYILKIVVAYGIVLVAVMYLLKNCSTQNKNQTEAATNEVKSPLDSIPASQMAFFKLEKKYDSIAPQATNALKGGIILENKAAEEKLLFNSDGFKNMHVKGWRGTVMKILSIDGDAGLIIKCKSEIKSLENTEFYLTSEAIVDEDNLMGKGPINKKSTLFNKIANLNENDIVEFSGNFYKSWFSNRYLYSCSEKEIYEHKYLFKIDEITLVK